MPKFLIRVTRVLRVIEQHDLEIEAESVVAAEQAAAERDDPDDEGWVFQDQEILAYDVTCKGVMNSRHRGVVGS